MKIVRLFVVLALALAAFGFSGHAQAGAFTYTSGIQVQNLEASEANVTLTYYAQDGTVAANPSDTIAASGSKTYFPIHASDGFNGSVVISSDKQVASVVNILGNNGAAAASYVGTGTGSTTVLIPLLMKGNAGYNTWFNVQNTGSADAAVSVAYSDGTNVGPVTIKAGASHTFDQATETHSAAVFSAVVTSDQPVAAAVIEESSAVMFAYSGFAAGVTNPVMPLINANNGGYITGVQIQNAGDAATNVTVSYTPAGAGTACTETRSIPAKGSVTFALAAFANDNEPTVENCVGLARFVGSAAVTTNSGSQPLVAIINQLLPGRNGEAYGSFNASVAGTTVVMPLIMDDNGGYFTGFNVQNVGSAATTVNCTFTNSTYTVSATLDAGEALNDLQNDMGTTAYVGSATCTAGTGGQIVAVVNELGASGSADQLLVYEGINP
ncbi:MAG: hypothetical protein ACOYYS_08090 [Chloroflexota bacterium]